MSRCYPYRSIRNVASGAALIETIKLQRPQEKLKTGPTKEKKREEKEKRKERKQKGKKNLINFDDRESEKLNNEKCSWDRDCLAKRIENEETERLEKSSLTDEHDEPVSIQSLCYLSDGTQSSNKRKRDSPPSNDTTVRRNIIRIRLASNKQREANPLCIEEQSFSTSGRAPEFHAQPKDIARGECLRKPTEANALCCEEQSCSTSGRAIESYAQNTGESLGTSKTKGSLSAISDSAKKENIAECSRQTDHVATAYGNKMEREESIYKALIEDWIPCPIGPIEHGSNDSDDQEWLFGTKHQGEGCKRFIGGDHVSSCQTLWPSGHYLPEADICALPYSIPF